MSDRTSGDTLAMSDSVAMTPTVQPAAAGTHLYVEVRRAFEVPAGRAERVTVIDREDMRFVGEMGGVATRPGRCISPPGP